jgi:hypothetical protein
MTKKIIIGVLIAFIIMLILQIIIIKHDNPPVLIEPIWDSEQTKQTFKNLCADCHSNETKWYWYSYIPPVSFLVQYDVNTGRRRFNISEYKKEDGNKSAFLFEKGEMPLRVYTLIHSDPALKGAEREKFLQGLEATFGKYKRKKLEENSYSHPEE